MCSRLCALPCLLILEVFVGCADSGAAKSSQAGPILPNAGIALPFTDLDGSQFVAAGGTRAIALIFILPDCPICNSYVPELNRLHEEFSKRDVTLLLVPADPEVTAEKARAYASEYNTQCPVVLDPEQKWLKRASATTAPEAAVFSMQRELLYRGRIDDQYVGLGKRRSVVTSHDLRDALEAILAGKS